MGFNVKNTKKVIMGFLAVALIGISAVYAKGLTDSRTPVEFYSGHTHIEGDTQGAPSHSGGTNSAGCHNGSVPYHCH